MDAEYRTTHTEFELALTILGTVISVTEGDRVIVDAGLKSISGEHGLPVIKSHRGLRFRKLNAEHGIIDILDPSVSLAPGETVEIWAQYADATINLHRPHVRNSRRRSRGGSPGRGVRCHLPKGDWF